LPAAAPDLAAQTQETALRNEISIIEKAELVWEMTWEKRATTR